MIITLKSSSAEAKIDTKGAQLISFIGQDNLQYLWQGDKKYWGGQSPILFPIVGGLRNGKTYINSTEYKMNRHGFARTADYQAMQPDASTAVFSFTSDDTTRAVYPFDFIFEISYRLDGQSLTWEYAVKNTGNTDMRFAIGGHPAFRCPLTCDETFEDYLIEFPEIENALCPTVNLETGLIDFERRYVLLENTNTIPLKHELFYSDALIFDDLKSRSCKLYSKKSGKGVYMDFCQFNMLGIWSAVNDAPFVCLEPWIGCATAESEDDCFESKRDMLILQPGESISKFFTVTIL